MSPGRLTAVGEVSRPSRLAAGMWLWAGGLGIAVVVGAAAAARPGILAALAVAAILAGAVWAGGYVPLGLLFVWFAAAGTGVDSGFSLGTAHVPAAYVLLGALTAGAVARAALRDRLPASLGRFLVATLLPVPALALLGAILGSDPTVIREESLICLVAAFTGALTLASLESRQAERLTVVIVVAGAVAAAKTVLIQATGSLSVAAGPLEAVSAVNPQFQVQRVILVGGDTLMALAIPCAVGLLRDARRWVAGALIATVSLCALGLSLTYTRTLLGAAAAGAAVTLSLRVWGPRGAVRYTLWKLAAAGAIVAMLVSFTFGQSDFTVEEALIRRFSGGSSVGSSSLGLRLADAAAALSTLNPLTLLVGRGLGADYRSPITPFSGLTPYVHMGYIWLMLKGGLALLVTLVAGLAWSARRHLRRARQPGRAGGATAGMTGAIASFLALNLLLNRFDAVEGSAFVGMAIAAGLLVGRSEADPETADGRA